MRRIQYNVLIIGFISVLLALYGSFLFARSITRPVKALVQGAGEIGKGNFDFSVDVRTGDELGILGRSFEEMARGLKEREFIRSTFARYVSADVVSDLIQNPEKAATGGEKKTLTVLFADLAGFTPMAEAMDAATLISFLNEYLERITDVVFRCRGTIDKFLGDGVMAFWGAPVPSQRHAADACLAALECRKALEILRSELGARGLPQLQARFGINTGEMIVGNVGSRSRLDYTVVGDEVNLASRLEAVNKRYGTRILISENTFREAGDTIAARELDRIRVAGKVKPVVIYELLAGKEDLASDYTLLLPLFERGLKLYRERSFVGASEMFDSALRISPQDGPSREYLARCRHLQESPPSDGWDGTLDLLTK
ncbi:MAG: adenylate/guanylate cyclase domain-containing protein [Armatimonadetes bacterium]|nr:adenylate/guanylate cyclase domain-containing protein [Armatimonadota bacterium]